MAVVARRRTLFRLFVAMGATAYIGVIALSPALHHDLQCHAQHPGHCDACRASVLAPGAGAPFFSAVPVPQSGGAVHARADNPCESTERGQDGSRAPPALL
jgi:hypothetical protein